MLFAPPSQQLNKLGQASLFSAAIFMLSACGSSNSSTTSPQAENSSSSSMNTTSQFTLNFKGMVGEMPLNCDDIYTGIGPDQSYSIGITDLRFFVSNLRFYDANGEEIIVTLDSNDFQLNHEAGSVSLIDLSSTDSGYCAEAARGTARTNTVITGAVSDDAIAAVSFDVGIPQATMKAVIASTDNVNDAPSPLAELQWSWASGYRHFAANFSLMNATHTDMIENSGFHFGSRDCGGAGKALSDQEACGLLNTPAVMLENFDPSIDNVIVDLAAMLANGSTSDFENGDNFGVQCHSGASQSACVSMFPNFGVDLSTGIATASGNSVFYKE